MKFLIYISFLVTGFAWANPCDNHFRLFEERYGSYQNAILVAKERTEILASIRSWQKFMGREMSQAQFKKAKIASFLKNSLKFDKPTIAKEYLESMSNQVQLAYHIIKKNKALEVELAEFLKTNPLDEKSQAMIQKLYQENLKQAKVIARHIDEYSTAFTLLQETAKGTGVAAEHAKFVLYKLQSQYILDSFFAMAKITEKETPLVKQVYQILDEFVEADIYHLKLQRREEALTALFSISPTETIFKYADRAILKVPWLNKSKFRQFIGSLEEEKIRYLYFPDIERVVSSEASADEKLKLMMNLNVSTENEFLTTFSRRVDAKETWRELKTIAEETEPEFFARMVAAEEKAKIKGELSLWKDNSKAKILTRFVDFAVASALGGGIAYFGLSDPNKEQLDQKIEQLTPDEDKELDDTLGVAHEAIQEMKNNP